MLHGQVFIGPRCEKTCLRGLQTTKVQTGLRSLIRTFVLHLLESIISKLHTKEISIFWLVCVAEETGLSLTLLEILKTGFLTSRPNL